MSGNKNMTNKGNNIQVSGINGKQFIIYIVLFMLVIVEIYGTRLAGYEYVDGQMGVTTETLEQVNGYNVEGTHFSAISDDSYIAFNSNLESISSFTISFNENLTDDKNINVYYDNGKGYNEKNYNSVILSKDENSYSISIPKGAYKKLKINIPGEFDLKEIIVSGTTTTKDNIRLFLYVMFCCFADICILVLSNNLKSQKTNKISILKLIKNSIIETNKQINSILENISRKIRLNIVNFFTIAGLIMGILMSVIVPTGQIPDEETHFKMIAEEYGLMDYFQSYCNYTYVETNIITIKDNPEEKVDTTNLQKYLKSKFEIPKTAIKPKFNFSMIKHFPMAIGLIVGIFLNLPIYFCLQLAELGAVIFFVIMGRMTLKYLPVKQHLMCAIMLLPMSLQQCSSINYDAVLLPICYFLIAYLLHFRYTDNKFKTKNLIIVLFLAFIICIVKIPYICILLLIFLIPKEKFEICLGNINVSDIIFKYRKIVSVVFIIFLCMGIYVLRQNYYVSLVLACLKNLKQYVHLLYVTITQKNDFYTQSLIGDFGWLQVQTNSTFNALVLIGLFIFGQKEDKCITDNKKKYAAVRTMSFLVFAGAYILVHTVMISWSFVLSGISESGTINEISGNLNNISIIEGVQGRYLLPVIFCAYMICSKIRQWKNIYGFQVVYYIIIFVEPVILLLNRYWR